MQLQAMINSRAELVFLYPTLYVADSAPFGLTTWRAHSAT